MRFGLLFAALLVAALFVVPRSTAAGPVSHPLKLKPAGHRSVVLGQASLASLR